MVEALNKLQGSPPLTCCTYNQWSSRSQSSPWSLYLSSPAGSRTTQLPLMCAYWKRMSRRAAMNRSVDAKSWHLMRPLKLSSLGRSCRTCICEIPGNLRFRRSTAGMKREFKTNPRAAPQKTVCWYSTYKSHRVGNFNAIDNANMAMELRKLFFQPWFLRADFKDPVFRLPFVVFSMITAKSRQKRNWPDIPSCKRNVGLHRAPNAPASQQLQPGAKISTEAMQKANCHSTWVTFRVVDR